MSTATSARPVRDEVLGERTLAEGARGFQRVDGLLVSRRVGPNWSTREESAMNESRGITKISLGMRRFGRRSARSFAVASAVVAVLSLNLLAVSTAGADPYWTTAIEIPGLATLNQVG